MEIEIFQPFSAIFPKYFHTMEEVQFFPVSCAHQFPRIRHNIKYNTRTVNSEQYFHYQYFFSFLFLCLVVVVVVFCFLLFFFRGWVGGGVFIKLLKYIQRPFS